MSQCPNCDSVPCTSFTKGREGKSDWHTVYCPKCEIGGGGWTKEEAEAKWELLVQRSH